MPPNAQPDPVSSPSITELPRACHTIRCPGFCVCPPHQGRCPPHQGRCPPHQGRSPPARLPSQDIAGICVSAHTSGSARRPLVLVHGPRQHFTNADPPCLFVTVCPSTGPGGPGSRRAAACREVLGLQSPQPRPKPWHCPSPWVNSGKL